jgi:uncharacterized protein YbjT (DUF2867 family)
MSTLYLVGGTGNLGSEIAKGLITAKGFSSYKALVRDEAKGQALRALGWTVCAASLENITAKDFPDAKVVVSALGGPTMVALESAVVKAAKEAGASLYVPSQFGCDFRTWGTSFPVYASKKQVLDLAIAQDLPTLCVFTGFFSDFIFGFLAAPNQDGKVTMVGDGSFNVSFTRRSDIGFVLAKALADPTYNQGGYLSMQGDCMSWKEAVDMYAKVAGLTLDITTLDPQEALKQENDLLEKGLQGDMGAFYGSFALHLLGEPARGNSGADVSAEATTLGVKLETLEETLKDVYGAK